VVQAEEKYRQLADQIRDIPNDVGRLVWAAEWVAIHLTDLHNELTHAKRTGQTASVGKVSRLLDHLASMTSLSDLALHTLSLLVTLDDSAAHHDSTVLAAHGSLRGPSGNRYRVTRLTWLPGVHLAPTTQPGSEAETKPRASAYRDFESIRSYMRQCALIPSDIEIEVGLDDNGPLSVRLAARRSTVSLRAATLTNALEVHAEFEVVSVLADAIESLEQARTVMRTAADDQIDVLVLTELSAAIGVLSTARAEIGGDFPLLVVGGLHHHERDEEWWNLAEVIGPSGEVVFTHKKLTRINVPDSDPPIWECHQVGSTLSVLPSPFGLITIAICKDVFDKSAEYEASQATLLLVPSLSPKTQQHADAAAVLVHRNLATTIVANRWGILDGEMHPKAGPSLIAHPVAGVSRAHGVVDLRAE
jgi:predicted amidohydrolase